MRILSVLLSLAIAAIPSAQSGEVPFTFALSAQSDLMKVGSEILLKSL
jgi:hypothetical protein